MRRPLFAILLAGLSLTIGPVAHALSCVHRQSWEGMSPAQRMQIRKMQFDVVFAGIPLDSHAEGDYQVTRFRVLRVFKGSAAPTQSAREHIVFSDPTEYATDKVYLVFAWNQDGTLLSSNECYGVIALPPRDGRPVYPPGLGEGWRPH
jgi:hypothetical protein